MTDPVHKVTCFITRGAECSQELLLFHHPSAGVQITAGTVNPGEDIQVAAQREAAEESGLDDLILVRALGQKDDPPPEGFCLINQPTTVYSRPDTGSLDWAHFRTGLAVEVLRHAPGFTQVRYTEDDTYLQPQYISYDITGWVPDEKLTDRRVRHFFLLTAIEPTHEQWTVTGDNTVFELFWASLNYLPDLVPTQHKWLKLLTETINDHTNEKRDKIRIR
jgi:8-oxo-dGTP pyrophosphatase MutT (NUDIX family)